MKKERNNIKWGVALTYITLFVNIFISIVYTPVMLRILGPSEHGLYSTVSSTLSWLSLLNLGIGASYIRFYARYNAKNDEDHIAGLNGLFLVIFILIGIIALVCGFYISDNLKFVFDEGLNRTEYKIARVLARIVTVNMAISFPASVFNSAIRAEEKFIQVKIVNFFQTVMSPMISLPLLLMGYGSIGMVAVTTVVNLIAYSSNVYYCLVKLRTKFSLKNIEKGILREILVFSFFIQINALIDQVNKSLDKILLARFVNTISVSVYTVGFSLYTYYGSFSNAVSSMFIPRVNHIVNKYEENTLRMGEKLTAIFIKLGRIQFIIQMLMCTGIIFFGQEFIVLWAGDGYENAYWIAVLLSVAFTIPLCQSIGLEIQRALNLHKVRTVVYLIMTIGNVTLTIILCQIYGEVGAAIGTAIAVVAIDVIFMNWFYEKKMYIDIKAFWKNIGQLSIGLILPLIVGISIRMLISLNTIYGMILGIVIYSTIYIFSMWKWGMNESEKQLIFGRLQDKWRLKNKFK